MPFERTRIRTLSAPSVSSHVTQSCRFHVHVPPVPLSEQSGRVRNPEEAIAATAAAGAAAATAVAAKEATDNQLLAHPLLPSGQTIWLPSLAVQDAGLVLSVPAVPSGGSTYLLGSTEQLSAEM